MAEIDNLTIKISAECDKAVKRIEKLSNSLGTLQGKLSSLSGTTGFNNLSASLTNLANAMSKMKNFDGRQFKTLATNINKLGEIDGDRLSSVAQGIREIASAMQELSGSSVGASNNVSSMADSLSRLNNTDSSGTSASAISVGSLSGALAKAIGCSNAITILVTVLTSLFSISKKLASSTKGVLSFFSSLATGSIQAAVTGVSAVVSVIGNLINKVKSLFSIGDKISAFFGKFYATYWGALRILNYIKKAIDIAADLNEVQNTVTISFGKMSGMVDTFVENSVEKLGMTKLMAKQTASTFQAMAKNLGLGGSELLKASEYTAKITQGYTKASENVAQLSLDLTQLTADLASVYSSYRTQEEVAQDMQAIFTGQTKPLRKYGIDLSETNLKQWALTEGLNSNVKAMTQAEKVLLRYQYVMAHTVSAQGDFERTSTSWHNQVVILKANIQELANVIGQGLIQALKPLVTWLNTALLSITNFANTVLNALGSIFGWYHQDFGGAIVDDTDDLADAFDDVADSTDKAKESAEKYKKTLLGIDEINALSDKTSNNSTNKSGSNTSSTGGTTNDSGWTRSEGAIDYFKSSIDDLGELGDVIARTLSDMMERIPWDDIYAKASQFGTNLATFLNGLFDPKNNLFENLGKTIAGLLNTTLSAVFSFSSDFKWDNFGESLGLGLQAFFNTTDVNYAAATLSSIANGISKLLVKAAEKIEFGDIGKKIGTGIGLFFNTLDVSTMSNAVTQIANGLLKLCTSAANEIDAKTVAQTIVTGITLIDWKKLTWNFSKFSAELGSKLASAANVAVDPKNKLFETMGSTLASSLNAITSGIFSFSYNFEWDDLGESLATGINTFFDDGEFTLLGTTIGTITSGIESSIYTAVTEIKWDDAGEKIGRAITGFFDKMAELDPKTKQSGWQKLGTTITSLVTGLSSLIVSATENIPWVEVGKGLGEVVDNVEVGKMILSGFSAAMVNNGGFMALLMSFIYEAFNDDGTAVGNSSGGGTKLDQTFKDKMIAVGGDAFDGLVEGLVKGAEKNPIGEVIIKIVKAALGINSPSTKFRDEVGVYCMEGLIEGFDKKIEDIKKWFTDLPTKVTTWMEDHGISLDVAFNFASETVDKVKEIFGIDDDSATKTFNIAKGLSFDSIWTSVSTIWNKVSDKVTKTFEGKDSVNSIWDNVSTVWGKASDKITKTFSGSDKLTSIWNGISSIWDKGDGTDSKKKFKLSNFVTTVWDKIKDIWNKGDGTEVKKKFKLSNFVTTVWNKIKDIWNKGDGTEVKKKFTTTLSETTKTIFNNLVKAAKYLASSFITLGKYFGYNFTKNDANVWKGFQTFASGGFPEEGPFFMNRGEIAGKFNNGKSVVANNMQIIEGIKEGVTDAMMSVYMATNGSSNNTTSNPVIESILQVDSEILYRMVKKGEQKYNNRYHIVSEVF